MNEYTSTTDFYASLDKAGFKRLIAKRKRYYVGLKLKEVMVTLRSEARPLYTTSARSINVIYRTFVI